jgi:hypothetical protein
VAVKGFKDAKHLRQDDDLRFLREREDFKKLLRELEPTVRPPVPEWKEIFCHNPPAISKKKYPQVTRKRIGLAPSRVPGR